MKRDDGVRRMLAAPQPTRREKESKEHAGRPPTNKKGEGEKEAKHGERLLAAPQPTRSEKQSKEDAGRPQPARREKERRKQSMGNAGRPPSNEKTRRSRNEGWAWAAPP